jgi:2-aminoadipate transaminase
LRPGARLGIEEQSYPGALEAAHAYGAELGSLEAPAAAYYVMPSISNPRGQPLAGALRDGLLARARARRSLIVEDDAYADTAFSGRPARPLLSDSPERVFHIGTFSKTLCPGLRVGWIVAPERYMRRVLRAKQSNDLQANGLSQSLLAEYLAQGSFDRLKQRARKVYQRRAKRLCHCLRERLPWLRFSEPVGGFSVWIETDSCSKEDELFELALEEGVSLDLGNAFCRSPSGRLSFRLSFSSVPEDSIDEGVYRLARTLHRLGCRKVR